MTNQPKFAVDQIWLDYNDNTQIISAISKDASDCFPISTYRGGHYTIEGKCDYGVPHSPYGLVKYIGKFTPENINACRHPDGEFFETGQEWIVEYGEESHETVIILAMYEGELYPIITTEGRYTKHGVREGDFCNRFNLKRLF